MTGTGPRQRNLNFTLRVTVLGIVMLCSHRMAGVMNSVHMDKPSRTLQHLNNERYEPESKTSKLEDEDYEISKLEFNMETRNEREEELKLGGSVEEDLKDPHAANIDTLSVAPKRRPRRGRNKRQSKAVSPIPLKVPLPVFIPSLPKSGTTSIHKYFLCGGHNSAHHVYRVNGVVKNKIGRCWKQNIKRGRDPLEQCGDHSIWSDTGFVGLNYRKGQNKSLTEAHIPCYYPLIEALDQIYTSYPNSTFLLITRDEDKWLNSIKTYHEGFIVNVWKRCQLQGFPSLNATGEDFKSFYRWHKQLIRRFAMDHPSLHYIEVPLEAEDAGKQLEDKIGVRQDCWGHHNRQSMLSLRQQEETDSN